MRALIETLCSERCAGRATGTPEGRAAREVVIGALRDAGLDPQSVPIPACNGSNVLATLPGEMDRWVLVAAHYDHLGRRGAKVYWGADDNAAAVAILVETARSLARERPSGRGVIVAAFDGEEPPWFGTDGMGSEQFARKPIVPLDRIDLMVCMDLVGHTLGGDALPGEVADSVFLLGAEHSDGTGALVDSMARSEPGVIVRRMNATVIPPLSDYEPFWRRNVPFAFLSNGRSQRYHTPDDRPEYLAYAKMESTARWLTRFVREQCSRTEPTLTFRPEARDDASTLRTAREITHALGALDPRAAALAARCDQLLAQTDGEGRLPESLRDEPVRLVQRLESALA